MLPFTHEEFVAVFTGYNAVIWPVQAGAMALGVLLFALAWWRPARAGRVLAAGLAAMWAWTGIVYHAMFFAAINPAAWGFAALFLGQALLLLWTGVLRDRLAFAVTADARGLAGLALVVYALALYPLVGLALGQPPRELPWFGVTPCPLTLFTLGLLLLTTGRPPWALFVVPVLWSLIGGTAAFLLAVPQDWPLLFGGLAALALVAAQGRRRVS
jgi:hypothetical protein